MSMPILDNSAGIPRHILMTADTAGGVWTYAMELCRMLSRWKIHVSLVTMGPRPEERHRCEVGKLRNVELFESEYRLEWMDDAEQDLERSAEWLMMLRDRVRPDLVHLNGYSYGALDWDTPVVVVAHSCVLSWQAAVKGSRPAGLETYRERVARGIGNADLLIAPSRAMLCEVERLYGPLASSTVIPNGRTAELFPAGEKSDLILATGRLWDNAKNLCMLDSIAPGLAWPVYLAGDALHPNGIRTNVEHAQYLGSLPADELARWFSRAAIYAAPATYEPFGLSILEASLAGCALVLGDIPSLRENWDGAAVFALPDDPDQFQSALRDLIQNPERRRNLAASAASRAQRFSPSAMVRRYFDAYRTAQIQFSRKVQRSSVERWPSEVGIA